MDYMLQVRITELAACLILIVGVLHGYSTGLVKTIYQMVKLILATIISIVLAPMIVVFIPQTVAFRYGVAYLGAFLIAILLLGIINCILGIVDHIPGIKTVNKLAGAVAGILFGFVILWIMMVIVGTFRGVAWCDLIVGFIQKSELLSWIHRINPIPDILEKLNFPII